MAVNTDDGLVLWTRYIFLAILDGNDTAVASVILGNTFFGVVSTLFVAVVGIAIRIKPRVPKSFHIFRYKTLGGPGDTRRPGTDIRSRGNRS